MLKQEVKQELKRYFELMEKRPEEFTNLDPSIEIELDHDKIIEAANSGMNIGVVYESPYHLMVVDLIKGKNGYYTYERLIPASKGTAVVVLLKKKNAFGEDEFIFLKQYRHALRDFEISCPRGFGKDGVPSSKNAIRKVMEETGYEVKSLIGFGQTVADSGVSGTKVSVYVMEVGQRKEEISKGYHGIESLLYLSEKEVWEYISAGKITDGFTLSAFMLYQAQKR